MRTLPASLTIPTLLLALCSPAIASTPAVAADAARPGFTTVRRLDGFFPHSIAAPAPGTVLVAGHTRWTGTRELLAIQVHTLAGVTVQELDEFADSPRLASSNGRTWMLNGAASDMSLWHWDGRQMVRQALPDFDDRAYSILDLAVNDRDVVILGERFTGSGWEWYTARLRDGAWHLDTLDLSDRHMYRRGLTLMDGRPVAIMGTLDPSGQDYLADLSEGHVHKLTAAEDPASCPTQGFAWTLTGEHPWDVTMWGQMTKDARGGWCQHYGGDAAWGCPAPLWDVYSATRISGGRQVLGGKIDYWPPSWAGTRTPGYALVARDGSVSTIPGSYGIRAEQLVTEPGRDVVWALDYEEAPPSGGPIFSLQRADLSGLSPASLTSIAKPANPAAPFRRPGRYRLPTTTPTR